VERIRALEAIEKRNGKPAPDPAVGEYLQYSRPLVAGRCADRYRTLKGEVQMALVRICNENGFAIPFNQMTVSLSRELMVELAKTIEHSFAH
jgi:hypothetical protein